jgi:exodeoxyribonuclease-3
MKIVTWNVNSLKVRLHHVLRWLEENNPDIVGLQETKTIDANFPEAEIREAGYEVIFSGQKTYNGVALLSKTPATDVVTELPGFADEQRRVMAATVGDIRIINLYVPNGEALDSPKFEYKTGWIAGLKEYLSEQIASYPKLVMMGDFNITATSDDVHDPEKLDGHIHCSELEREWLQEIIDMGVTDTYRMFEQEPKSFSWWDYRGGSFWKNRGLRIDYVFASDEMKQRCTGCKIDKRERQFKQPSDHAPVMAEFSS